MRPKRKPGNPIWKKLKILCLMPLKTSRQLEKLKKKPKRTIKNLNQMLMKLKPQLKQVEKKHLRNFNLEVVMMQALKMQNQTKAKINLTKKKINQTKLKLMRKRKMINRLKRKKKVKIQILK